VITSARLGRENMPASFVTPGGFEGTDITELLSIKRGVLLKASLRDKYAANERKIRRRAIENRLWTFHPVYPLAR